MQLRDLSQKRSASLVDSRKTSLNHFKNYLKKENIKEFEALEVQDVTWELIGKFGCYLAEDLNIKALNTAHTYLSTMRNQLLERFEQESHFVIRDEKKYGILRDAIYEIYCDNCELTGEPLIKSHAAIERKTRLFINKKLFESLELDNMNLLNWDFNMVGRISEVVIQ